MKIIESGSWIEKEEDELFTNEVQLLIDGYTLWCDVSVRVTVLHRESVTYMNPPSVECVEEWSVDNLEWCNSEGDEVSKDIDRKVLVKFLKDHIGGFRFD